LANQFTYVPYKATGYFSTLVNDYLSQNAGTKPFYNFTPDANGIAEAIEQRSKFNVNRKTLVAALTRQYAALQEHAKSTANIQLLLNENTFTICTAHQPNLLTGYLYFIYKILHAIKLAEQLNTKYPDKHFVPVYYMGSEDNDIEELGAFRFRGEKYVWDGDGQTGAVGRMNTTGLKTILQNVFKVFGPPGKKCEDLETMLTNAYLKHSTIAEATQYLVHELFGRYGLIALNPDEAELKASFMPVMEDELLRQSASQVITAQIKKLETAYKIQAHPRLINLFYLNDQLRERIEIKDDKWVVLNTNIEWNKEDMLQELNVHPERFSPNVMLRGLYQETILPNVVFIGGGAEVAYWLQLKTLFAHYNTFFPCIHLRQSVLWVNGPLCKLRQDLGFSVAEIFKTEPELVKTYIATHATEDWQTDEEMAAIASIFQTVKHKAEAVDKTLGPAAGAALTKMKYQMELLEKKMLRAEKKKMFVQTDRITRLKTALFPSNGLQERIENFTEYYLEYGAQYFDILLAAMNPLDPHFVVVEC
jgi:bacillithiol biosynthesis cysteine-adding enzyme BshC